MLLSSNQLKISQFNKLYDIVVPENHLLRKIKKEINFSFVNRMLENNYCKYYGRPAKGPELMYKLLFLKEMYNLSDETVIESASVNMAYKYFLDLDPEDKLPDASLLTKFRKNRLKGENLLEEMLKETVRQALEKGLIKSNTIIVDATHSKSKCKKETPIQILKKATKNLRKVIYKTKEKIAEIFPQKPHETATLDEEIKYSEELLSTIQSNIGKKDVKILKELSKVKSLLDNGIIRDMQSSIDTDAKIGHKSKEDSFFGYKSHIGMLEERIIAAVEVTTGEVADGKYLANLVEQAKESGIEVNELLGGAAYSGTDNLKYMEKNNIKAITPLNPVLTHGNRKEEDGFEYIKDADMLRCPAGHLSIRKDKVSKKSNNKTPAITYYFDVEKCKNCNMKDGCYKPGSKTRSYSIRILSDLHKNSMNFETTVEFKERKKERYKIL